MLRSGPIEGEVVAKPVIAENGITLPLIDVTAIAESHDEATALAQRAASALAMYVEQQQRSNRVPASDRVVLQRLLRAEEATIVKPRPKSIPIVVFLVVMAGTIGLAFLLENLRPSVQLVSELRRSRRRASRSSRGVGSRSGDPRGRRAPPTHAASADSCSRLGGCADDPPALRPWQHLLAALILVILLVPIRRYSLPADLPFQLELYRLFVAAARPRMDRLAARRPSRAASPDRVRGAARASSSALRSRRSSPIQSASPGRPPRSTSPSCSCSAS